MSLGRSSRYTFYVGQDGAERLERKVCSKSEDISFSSIPYILPGKTSSKSKVEVTRDSIVLCLVQATRLRDSTPPTITLWEGDVMLPDQEITVFLNIKTLSTFSESEDIVAKGRVIINKNGGEIVGLELKKGNYFDIPLPLEVSGKIMLIK